MTWKFWQKTAAPTAPASDDAMVWPVDSFAAVKMLAALYLGDDLPPFSHWRATDAVLTSGTERIARVGSGGLVLSTWFWQYAATHGDIAARMARDGFCLVLGGLSDEDKEGQQVESLLSMIDDARQSFEDMPEEKRSCEVKGEKVVVNFHWYLAIALLTQVSDSPYFGKDSLGDADLNVALCLAQASEHAQSIWVPMLAHIGPFNPASFPNWKWSASPGAFERHLQRRHNNPLFAKDRQVVSASDVYYARVRDVQALEEVRRGFSDVFKEVQKGDLPPDWHPYLDGVRERLDDLYDQLQRAGGNSKLEHAYRVVREHIIETWRSALVGSQAATDALSDAEALVNQRQQETTRWVHQLSGPEKTIPLEEVTCSLLSESVDDIVKSVAHFEPNGEAMTNLRAEALKAVMKALSEGREVPQHRQKLAALGVAI